MIVPAEGAWMKTITDVGPPTLGLFREKLEQERISVWNGPLDMLEMEPLFTRAYAVASVLVGLSVGGQEEGGDDAA
jgi:3-phosphoglycerate kinase